jgi:transposase
VSEVDALKARIAELGRINAEQAKRIERLERMVRELTNRLRMNSRNSSMPPSSDWKRTRNVRRESDTPGRRRGGQIGHEGTTRKTFPPSEVDRILRFFPEHCRNCCRPLTGAVRMVEAHQVVEVPAAPAEVTEHRRYQRICLACGGTTTVEFPQTVPSACVGPRLQAVMTSLTGRYRLSRREAREAGISLFGAKASVALGTISALERRASEALEGPHAEAVTSVRASEAANVDETAWWEDKGRAWLWGAATPQAAAFRIHPTRSEGAFHQLMGSDYAGVLGTDRWTSYHGHDPLMRQLCWAHLKRNFQALTEQGHKGATCIGRLGLRAAKAVNRAWRGCQEGRIAHTSLRVLLHPERKRLKVALLKGSRSSDPKTAALCRDVLKRFTSLWTFTRRKGVEPTNNRAERSLRKAVLWRKGSFGSDSPGGSRFAERMLTVSETLRIQGRNVVDYIQAAILAHARGQPHPPLLYVESA